MLILCSIRVSGSSGSILMLVSCRVFRRVLTLMCSTALLMSWRSLLWSNFFFDFALCFRHADGFTFSFALMQKNKVTKRKNQGYVSGATPERPFWHWKMNSLRFTTLKQHFSAPPVHSSAHAPPPRPILFYAKALRCWLFVLALPCLWLLLLLLTFLGINLFIYLSVIGIIESSGNRFSCFTCIYSLIIGIGVPFGGVRWFTCELWKNEYDSQKIAVIVLNPSAIAVRFFLSLIILLL